jgi:ribosomal-protein-alanine N-acetyltransferase
MTCSELPKFETERLFLRGLQKGDESFLAMLDSDPLVMQHIHQGPLSEAKAARWAQLEVEAHLSLTWRLTGKWLVSLRHTSAPIGWVNVGKLRLSDGDYRSVGYEFAPPYWGYGYAPEAITAVVDYLFDRLEEPSVFAYARPDNKRSSRVLHKVGLVLTGRQIKDDDTKLCDLYKIDLEEWMARRAGAVPPAQPTNQP